MDEFLLLFGGIPLSTVITFIVAVVFFGALTVKVYKFITSTHDEIQSKEKSFSGLKKDMEELKEKQVVTKEEWEELKKEQDHLKTMLEEVLETQKKIIAKQDSFEEETRSHSLNKLRDRLLQSYRYYTDQKKNPLGSWSEMEKEAFYSLLEDYYKLGGNSFVKEVVAPAMAGLNIIAMSDAEEISKLMTSRKG